MDNIQSWMNQLTPWYKTNGHCDKSILINAINSAPNSIFTSIDSQLHSDALAYWLDACLTLSHIYQNTGNIEQAFSYRQFAYSKVQEVATLPNQSQNMKRWSLKKLDSMIVGLMAFCQQQQQEKWQHECVDLVNYHVLFMEGQYHQNLAYPSKSQLDV
ncbi:hypothetical protein L4D09_26440 [Photobacterium makurazakiensis]|uniref:hypothetical protein n=1 Tax=Photobacterium makurazakiensis TaxID=2910234 RepID=UPI003D0BC8ED